MESSVVCHNAHSCILLPPAMATIEDARHCMHSTVWFCHLFLLESALGVEWLYRVRLCNVDGYCSQVKALLPAMSFTVEVSRTADGLLLAALLQEPRVQLQICRILPANLEVESSS